MRKAAIYRNGKRAGILTEESRNKYIFRYEDAYFADSRQPPVSLTLPKTQQEYESNCLFPFFFNMLSEGANRKLQCTQLRIDENDNFGLLMATAQQDAAGAITVKPVIE
ncbi:MAG: HipA N-terminal domain-containing protein [Tannerella sp.]|jgi:serine/threonine-protein kinase HipA|nr:HipA N-terminal domain-containing protein [Tannerella sp.]